MKVSDFVGMKVIDIGAKEVGKVEDLAVFLKESVVERAVYVLQKQIPFCKL